MSFSTTQNGPAGEVREKTKADLESQSNCPAAFVQAIDEQLAQLDPARPIALSAHGHSWGEGQTAGNISLNLDISVPHHDG